MPSWTNAYEDAYNQARAANENRYNDILNGYAVRQENYDSSMNQIGTAYQSRQDQVMADIAGVGDSQRQQLRDTYAANLGQSRQSAIQRGLGNSTVLDSLTRGVQSDNEKAKTQLADSLSRENADYYTKLSGDTLNFWNQKASGDAGMAKEQLDFKERRTDAYPDMNTYAALARAGGNPGGLGGGFSMGGSMGGPSFGKLAQTPDPAIMAQQGRGNIPTPMLQPPGGFPQDGTTTSLNNMNSYNAWAGQAAAAMAAQGMDILGSNIGDLSGGFGFEGGASDLGGGYGGGYTPGRYEGGGGDW